MKVFSAGRAARLTICLLFSIMLAISPARLAFGQTESSQSPQGPGSSSQEFRLERIPVAGGGELLTIFGRLDGLPANESKYGDLPLVSVLRDTLGDDSPENDRLRYLWMLTYTRPSTKQKLAAAVPFLYSRVGNRSGSTSAVPPPVIDLAATERDVWNAIFWTALQSILLDPYGFAIKASTRTYRRNVSDYRKAHLIRALAVLSLYESTEGGSQVFSDDEMRDIQGRLMLTEKTLGGIVDDIYLQRVYEKQTTEWKDIRGHNWELLRQRAESESLYFEPLELPDGSATHALVWISRPDLAANRDRPYSSRFLNISNPWRDDRLRNWKGYSETRYFDSENRPVAEDSPDARPVQMIPLALYGLDHPKIPILLVDFRDAYNPKKREMSRRVIEDVARNVLSLSKFGDIPYFLGRTLYDFVTGRRGMDVNQPSRVRAYSQLKLLLSLNASLDSDLRDEISKRVERVSLNPLENGMNTEARLAREQYEALVAYAQRPDGLPAKMELDRRAEMVPLKHGKKDQVLFKLGNILSFGLYTHREKATQEVRTELDKARTLAYHERFIREVASSTPVVEVVWNVDDVRRSMRYIADNGRSANGKTAKAIALIFARTEDDETRHLCLEALYRINNETAKKELLALYKNDQLEGGWRPLIVQYLRNAVREDQRISRADAKVILSMVGP